jgi:ketosteroid isomerase-like protein
MSVDALREAIEAQDRQRYAALLAEDVRFFSPIEADPSVSREAASMVSARSSKKSLRIPTM